MERLQDFGEAEVKLLQEIRRCLESVRQVVNQNPVTASGGVNLLNSLRKVSYEDINQLQHEEMALSAARLLQETEFRGESLDWYWNPRQTGDAIEPDIRAVRNGEIMVSAEVTTSQRPIGTIDTRMRNTLAKLNKMPGRRFYFVKTGSMEHRAKSKIKRAGFAVEVWKI
jgi:hypothetical protein